MKNNKIKIIANLMFMLGAQFCFGQVEIKNVSSIRTGTNEPSIGIDPYAGRVIIGSNVDLLFLSKDGGFSFTEKKLTSSYGVYGDPVIFINEKGTYFYTHLSKTPGKKAPEMWDRIVVQKSNTFGDSFFNGTAVGYVEGKMQDKPWLSGDMNKKSLYYGRMYLAWTEFDKYKSASSNDSSRIKFAYSDTEGDSFSEPVVISDTAGDCSDGDNTVEGVNITPGKNGVLFATWAARGNIYLDISNDGGKTWGQDRVICQQVGGWDQQVPYLSRCNSLPFSFCDKKGKLFVVFGDRRNKDLDVFISMSSDNGLIFTKPTRINKDPLGNGKDQFMPNIAYDRIKGCFYIIYYSREQSMLNIFTETRMVYGKKIAKLKEITLSKAPFSPSNKQFFGDYLDIDALNGAVGATWTEIDYETNIITIKAAIGPSKAFHKHINNYAGNVNEFLLADSNILYIHYHIGENDGFKIELARFGKTVYLRNQIEAITPGNYEEKLKIDMQPGTYEIKITYRGRTYSKSYTIK